MKKLLALVLSAMFILAACEKDSKQDIASNPFDGLGFEDVPANQADSADIKSENSEIVWGDTESELAREFFSLSGTDRESREHEESQRYKELLGIESRKDFSGIGHTFSGDYFLTTYYIADLHAVGYVIDTNLAEPCSIDISITEVNPDTGEEKVLSDSADGDVGVHLAVFADNGFVIKAYKITTDFSTQSEKIDEERTDELLENELFLERFESMTPEEQDALMAERYQQMLQEWSEDGGDQ